MVIAGCRWSGQCGRWVWTAQSVQDAGLLQFGGAATTPLPAGGLLPGPQDPGVYWLQQEGGILSDQKVLIC